MTLSELLARHARPGNGSADIYWVDAGFIDQLRTAATARESARPGSRD